jgi:hypothetical protein
MNSLPWYVWQKEDRCHTDGLGKIFDGPVLSLTVALQDWSKNLVRA